jgi:glucose/arabinose dehydrogenase
MRKFNLGSLLFPAALATASCGSAQSGDTSAQSSPAAQAGKPFAISEHGTFKEAWALAFAPGTQALFITERAGSMKFVDLPRGRQGTVTGLPAVDYGGQGGLGDVAFLPSEAASTLSRRTIYLTWAEAGDNDTRGAALGRGTLVCEEADACRIEGLKVIWRQTPKVTGRGHFSHKIAFSPGEKYLFLSSGERQKGTPAQDLTVNLGKVLRLNLDGTPATGNPFAQRGGVSREIWSYGHRNLLGLQFDQNGQLYNLEHGPAGGDEINRVEPGKNYGWPIVSNGSDYNGADIPDHKTRPEFAAPVISWNPVIAPGDFLFYSGKLWPEWKNQALIAAMQRSGPGVVRVSIVGDKGTEAARYSFDKRLRDITEAADGSLYVIEDGPDGRLLHLTPAK